MRLELKKNIDYIMKEFYPIGETPEGGVTRLGYSEIEDQMHNKFLEMAKSFGLNTQVDEVGNSYAYIGEFDEYHLSLPFRFSNKCQHYDSILGCSWTCILKLLFDHKSIPVKTVALM